MKKIAIFLLVLTLLTTLVSCGEGVSGEQAKTATESFVDCIATGDYDGAVALMHPDCESTVEEMETLATALAEYGVDFTADAQFEYTGFYSSFYNSQYKGAGYELSGYVTIGDIRLVLTSLVVRNDAGYGIYGINFEPADQSSVTNGSNDDISSLAA